jgi:hypothetical protein
MFITNDFATWKYVKTKQTKPINLDLVPSRMIVEKYHFYLSNKRIVYLFKKNTISKELKD